MLSTRNIIAFLIIIVVSGFLFLSAKQSIIPNEEPPPTQLPDIVTVQSVLEPETSEVYSPDGKMKLMMENTPVGDKTNYSFSVVENETQAKSKIYSKAVISGTSFEISLNAWSPDNKYFFITEKHDNSANYLVFKADSESFASGEQYVDVVPVFAARNTGFRLSEITGWDSETLLHVYTTKENGERGSSFWFEIPSKAIIQLASR